MKQQYTDKDKDKFQYKLCTEPTMINQDSKINFKISQPIKSKSKKKTYPLKSINLVKQVISKRKPSFVTDYKQSPRKIQPVDNDLALNQKVGITIKINSQQKIQNISMNHEKDDDKNRNMIFSTGTTFE